MSRDQQQNASVAFMTHAIAKDKLEQDDTRREAPRTKLGRICSCLDEDLEMLRYL